MDLPIQVTRIPLMGCRKDMKREETPQTQRDRSRVANGGCPAFHLLEREKLGSLGSWASRLTGLFS